MGYGIIDLFILNFPYPEFGYGKKLKIALRVLCFFLNLHKRLVSFLSIHKCFFLSVNNFLKSFRNWGKQSWSKFICLICFLIRFKDGRLSVYVRHLGILYSVTEAFMLSVKHGEIVSIWSLRLMLEYCHLNLF